MLAMQKGLNELCPIAKLSKFSSTDVEFLLRGREQIDLDEWQKWSKFKASKSTGGIGGGGSKGTSATATPTTDEQLYKWFWEIVHELSSDQRLLLLKFVTGSSRLPFGCLKGGKPFTLNDVEGLGDWLPKAHTCFNRLDIVRYESKEVFKHKLLMAIEEGVRGFYFE